MSVKQIGSGAKESIQRLSKGGVKKNTLTIGQDYAPQPDAIRGTQYYVPPIKDDAGGGGPVSPLDMIITATVMRSIPVPPGATTVDVEDASEFTLTDAEGTVYTVQSVTWPA